MQRLWAAAEGKALVLDQCLQLRRVSDVSRCARGLRLTVLLMRVLQGVVNEAEGE
jgi:hypothetical protein